ncbi:MAG: signal peptide prediction [Hydrogenophaga sp.]|nr:signal peptide prediction [Hydrogenophaga sp.]
MKRPPPTLARLLWAMPCSLLGLLLGALALALGGSARRRGHTLEIALAVQQADVPVWAARLPFWAITLGHVIVGQSHEALAVLRSHERVHVRQYERWGVFLLLAYPASSLCAWLQGRCPYRGNRFEQQAFAQAANHNTAACGCSTTGANTPHAPCG